MRETSTQPSKAATEADKDGVLIERCRKKCCSSVQSEHLKPVVLTKHHEFRSKTGSERTEWLNTILAVVNLDAAQPFKAIFGADTIAICTYCFRHLHGVPKTTMRTHTQRAREGIKRSYGGNKGGRASSSGASAAPLLIDWLKEYANVTADVWPHKQHVTLPQFTWRAVYDKCMQELTFSGATYETFMAARKEGCTHIKVRTHNGMGKCDDCTLLKELIDKHTGAVKKKWEAEKAKHDDWHTRERQDKYKCIKKAKGIYKTGWARNCMYLESDSMDQAKTQIPHSAEESKTNADLEKLQLHVTIVRIFNGDEDHIFTYVWPAYLSGGSNASITFILDALGRIEIPPTVTKLYAFTDNAGGEYKNRFVMALWHCLVERGLFIKIKHCFLGVGHTHDWIVDGIFKHFAEILKHSRCFTAADLMQLIGTSRGKDGKTAKPIIIYVTRLGAFSSLFLPHLVKRVVGHTEPRSFKYEREEGVVRHWYRMQVNSSKRGREPVDWAPFNRSGYQLFTGAFPDLTTAKCLPELAMDCASLERTLNAYRLFMTQESIQWWEELLANNRAAVANQCVQCRDFRRELLLHAQSKGDEKELAKEKARKRSKAHDGLKRHLQSDSDHAVFVPLVSVPTRSALQNA